MEEIKVIQVNGEVEPFSEAKLVNSIKNAFNSVGIEPSEGFINYIKGKIKERVEKTSENSVYSEKNTIYSEEISAFILNALLEEDLMWVYSSWIKFNKRF